MSASPLRTPLPGDAAGTRLEIAAAPVDNVLSAFALLGPPDKAPGLDPWVARASAVLGEPERDRHAAIFWAFGLGALVSALPAEAPRELPAWLDALATLPPERFRARLLDHMAEDLFWDLLLEADDPASPEDLDRLAEDPAARHRVLVARFQGKLAPEAIQEAEDLLAANPSALLDAVVGHLRMLWETVGAREWARVAPLVEASAVELSAIDLRDQPLFPALERLTGRDLRGILSASALRRCARIRLVPSAHSGPYLLWFGDERCLRISFGLRPAAAEDAPGDAGSPLERAVLLRRLEALADESRLAILLALRDEGPLETAAILERLGLSRSAASRHLRQLVANGLVMERRAGGPSKEYALRPEALEALARSVRSLGS